MAKHWDRCRDELLMGCTERLQHADEIRNLAGNKNKMSVGYTQFHLNCMTDKGWLSAEGDKRGRRWRLTPNGKDRKTMLQRQRLRERDVEHAQACCA